MLAEGLLGFTGPTSSGRVDVELSPARLTLVVALDASANGTELRFPLDVERASLAAVAGAVGVVESSLAGSIVLDGLEVSFASGAPLVPADAGTCAAGDNAADAADDLDVGDDDDEWD